MAIHPVLATIANDIGASAAPIGIDAPTRMGVAGVYHHSAQFSEDQRAAADAAAEDRGVSDWLSWNDKNVLTLNSERKAR